MLCRGYVDIQSAIKLMQHDSRNTALMMLASYVSATFPDC